jgi:CDP-diacylglycerol---glycerol-3-phosphate 3-phosphatidyltransferase
VEAATMITPGGLRSARLLAAGTGLRIVLTPVIMALCMAGGSTAETVGAILFCVAAGTDWLDGRLARRWGVTTKLGSFLDTTADKLLVTGVLFALVSVDRASPWIAGLIICREIVIMGLRGVIATDGTVMAPSALGKLKTAVQFLAISLAIVRVGDPVGGLYVDQWVMIAAAVITVASAVDYLLRASSSLSLRILP